MASYHLVKGNGSPANFVVVIIATIAIVSIVFITIIISVTSVSRQLTSIAVALTVVFTTIVALEAASIISIATRVGVVGMTCHKLLPPCRLFKAIAVTIVSVAIDITAMVFLTWSIFPLLSSIALLILVIAIAVVAPVFSVTFVALAFTAVVIFALAVIVVKATFNHLVRPIFLEEEGATLALEELTVAP
jgi:hypothetical protein